MHVVQLLVQFASLKDENLQSQHAHEAMMGFESTCTRYNDVFNSGFLHLGAEVWVLLQEAFHLHQVMLVLQLRPLEAKHQSEGRTRLQNWSWPWPSFFLSQHHSVLNHRMTHILLWFQVLLRRCHADRQGMDTQPPSQQHQPTSEVVLRPQHLQQRSSHSQYQK